MYTTSTRLIVETLSFYVSLTVCFHVQSAVCGWKEQSYITDLEAATGNCRDTAELQQEMTCTEVIFYCTVSYLFHVIFFFKQMRKDCVIVVAEAGCYFSSGVFL